MQFLTQIVAIVAGAFVSEDLTLIAVALLIREMHLGWGTGLLGAFLGIFLGDLALAVIGRLTRKRVLTIGWIARRLPAARLEAAADWFDRQGLWAMIAARFIPGSRLPLYWAAGMFGRNGAKVVAWTFVAALVWTPSFVGAVALVGEPLLKPLRALLGGGWMMLLFACAGAYGAVHLSSWIVSLEGRRWLKRTMARSYQWEFWPSWLFYLPILPYFLWLALRHGGIRTITAANPGILAGGIVEESKADILAQLPAQWVLDFERVERGVVASRVAGVRQVMSDKGWNFPLILKPDNGYRGASVKLVHSIEEAAAYLSTHDEAILVQVYHPGPGEAGIFYYRLPGEAHGHIYSITHKVFPEIVGDGVRTIEELVWQHPRYSLQAPVFLERYARRRHNVLPAGERMRLAMAGNHCQGTKFEDGSWIITPPLEERMDAIARAFKGFYFGRFDVRYRDLEAFKRGEDLAVVELNGVTSEPTNLYDPRFSLRKAYAILMGAWRLGFEIGAANRAAGVPMIGAWELVRLVVGHFRKPKVHSRAD